MNGAHSNSLTKNQLNAYTNTQKQTSTTKIGEEEGRACSLNMFRCENGPCIDEKLRCNGINDCPFDMSDELDCERNERKFCQRTNNTHHILCVNIIQLTLCAIISYECE